MAEFTLEQKQALALAAARRRRAESEQSVAPEQTPEPTPEKPVDFSFSEMVSNIPSSTLQLGKDIVYPFMHPIDTAKGLQSVGQGIVEKFVPNEINGVDFGQTQNDDNVDAVGGMIKDRYGSFDATKQTLMNDPAGALMDASMLVTGGLTAGAKTANTAAKIIPKKLPNKMLADSLVMRPTMAMKKDSLVSTMLKEGIRPTDKGINKGLNLVGELNNKIDDLIASAPPGATFDRATVLKYIDDVKADLGGKVVNGGGNLKIIDKIVDDFKTHMDTLKTGDRFTPEELQAFKKNVYKEINWKNADQSLAANDTYMAQARAAREGIETISDDIKPINQREGKVIELLDELPRMSGKMANYRTLGMNTALSGLIGTAIGGPIGTAAGMAVGTLGHPRVKSSLAYALQAAKNTEPKTRAAFNLLAPALAGQTVLNSGRYKED